MLRERERERKRERERRQTYCDQLLHRLQDLTVHLLCRLYQLCVCVGKDYIISDYIMIKYSFRCHRTREFGTNRWCSGKLSVPHMAVSTHMYHTQPNTIAHTILQL